MSDSETVPFPSPTVSDRARRSTRGTCWSSRGGCWFRASARTAGTGTRPRCWCVPTCRRRIDRGPRRRGARRRRGRRPGPSRPVGSGRRPAPCTSERSADPACPASGRIVRRRSEIECSAKNSGPTRRNVASSATALAPFSQNSNVRPRAGIRPRTSRTVEPVGLVEDAQRLHPAAQTGFVHRVLERDPYAGQPGGDRLRAGRPRAGRRPDRHGGGPCHGQSLSRRPAVSGAATRRYGRRSSSRRMSMWPRCRAVSSSMWTRTHRNVKSAYSPVTLVVSRPSAAAAVMARDRSARRFVEREQLVDGVVLGGVEVPVGVVIEAVRCPTVGRDPVRRGGT